MTRKSESPKPDNAEQSKRFEEAARQLEADETGKTFKRAISVVVKPAQLRKLDEPLTHKTSPTIVTRKDH